MEQGEQDLNGRRTGICKRSYRLQWPGVHALLQARERDHSQQWLKEFSAAFLPRKIIFQSQKEKNKWKNVSSLECWIFDLIWKERVCTWVHTSLLLFYERVLL